MEQPTYPFLQEQHYQLCFDQTSPSEPGHPPVLQTGHPPPLQPESLPSPYAQEHSAIQHPQPVSYDGCYGYLPTDGVQHCRILLPTTVQEQYPQFVTTPVIDHYYQSQLHKAPPPTSTYPKKQKRAAQACEQCRQRKQKCDEGQPCSFCKESSARCQYREPLKQSETMDKLFTTMESSSQLLDKLISNVDQMETRLRRIEHNMQFDTQSFPGS